MPKVSRETATQIVDPGPVEDRHDDLDGYTAAFVTFRQKIDHAPLLRGLPDDRCACPHWGYLFKGTMIVRYADHEETIEAGDAFYLSPGHVPTITAGSEFVMFSPADQLADTDAAIMRNLSALQGTN